MFKSYGALLDTSVRPVLLCRFISVETCYYIDMYVLSDICCLIFHMYNYNIRFCIFCSNHSLSYPTPALMHYIMPNVYTAVVVSEVFTPDTWSVDITNGYFLRSTSVYILLNIPPLPPRTEINSRV